MANEFKIQISLDVMSVRKPLLNTPALKHQGVTIIFNHDHDRIMFRNETANSVSHDFHSYLHVKFADGTPPRKAMVMTGENMSNDVDAEVHAGDGDDVPEAREASDGVRRAIADADQARQPGISGETKTTRALRTPEPPTDTVRMLHYTTHVPFGDGAHSAGQVVREVLHVPEAREASDGVRRAIADADQARQPGISGETKTTRALRTPEPPTDTEVPGTLHVHTYCG